ncbi:putative disease resistance RPP13-like protein 1 [Prosopis cineraria]|uniref:putative disease resistance RPP13-like protein 1 n=1 Tax=Prosopis cineraria TaxID=364024 RepID=UPI00240FBAAE|nr:putative disease resistance RPP13-like protein 1 [Prosopis cineraria]XP_054814280.1 putative disease resistance RPP13-like protein 1 [Prosopis cineraria]XP_054814281.1 putative disease resistance RPP13-like protein 1 [Prosopis cineraria]XP_054814282.1 putative disease resistance RPP13-like protein 1 [Prosopis cineraria]XP_054814284.1 putative disease resistance RPP13-like protein 1 [Prosopis cineraria]XP_054814285.1 putative disease resistance RPP13-like protein 1 [Prosopis cineraria]XP_05
MAELVAGAFLSSSLQVAFGKLASREVLDFFHGRNLEDGLLKKLRIILLSVNQVIEDAEERQYRNRNVKQWLAELKDEVFKAEDLIDEIATEALRQKLDAESQTLTGKVRGCFTTFINERLLEKSIESRMKQVLENLEYLINQNKILGLRQGLPPGTPQGVSRKGLHISPTTSLIDESSIYGRDADRKELIDRLLSPNTSGNRFDLIAIVGLGGLGKTTLARLVYDEKNIKDQFKHRAWVCISENSDYNQAMETIFRELNPHDELANNFDGLQRKLKEKLTGKKIFLVLDDVWNENNHYWEEFQTPFKDVAVGSKIIVTTRSKRVAEVMHYTYIRDLKILQLDDCLKLFAKYAFNDQHHVVDQIGVEIVKKCGGLPLAIKSLGCLLCTKSPRDWKKILKNDIWNLSEDDSNIIPSLRLSYHYLPSNQKRCFAYCCIFPKNYNIDKNVLIQLWMANGLLHSSNEIRENLEEVGNEIFNALESRSFLEPSKKGGNYFIMHDLLNDLAKSIMGEFSLHLEGDRAHEIPAKTRYLSCDGTTVSENIENIFTCHELHNFLNFGSHHIKGSMLSRIARLKFLRALSLAKSWQVRKLNNGITNLKHLRYLDLSRTSITRLPNSMCSMINLQTLKLKGCSGLKMLPPKLHKLINLHHLDLENSGIIKMPKHMGKLKHLQTMTHFFVGKDEGFRLSEIGALNHLRGMLTILNLANLHDLDTGSEAKLKEKCLDRLNLNWGGVVNREMSQKQEQVLEALEPNCSLRELTITKYGGIRFPNWLDDPNFHNLVSLCLKTCTNCETLPMLGQLPILKRLEIEGFNGIKVIGQEFYGNASLSNPFPSLTCLSFKSMNEWEEWNICHEGASFPKLKELYISACRRLTTCLPQHLPCLKKLHIFACPKLGTLLPKSLFLKNMVLEEISLEVLEPNCSLEVLEPNCSLRELTVACHKGIRFPNQLRDPNLLNLVSLCLKTCTNCETLPMLGQLPILKRLEISRFSGIKVIGQEFYGNASLSDPFPSLTYLSFNSMKEWEEWNICHEGASFPYLEELYISACPRLTTCLPQHLPSLKKLDIRGCQNLETSLPKSPVLEMIHLRGCVKISMKHMPTWSSTEMLPPLHDLTLDSCPEMESLPQGGLLSHLNRLKIRQCPKVIASGKDWGLHELLSLKELEVSDDFEDVESFPEEGLLPPNLHSLVFNKCLKLKTINYRGLLHLHSLTSLEISSCPSLSFQDMPEQGLPRSLSYLHINQGRPLLKKRCKRGTRPDWPKISHIPHIALHM